MIERKFFRYHKTNGESCDKMDALVRDFRHMFDQPEILRGEHDGLIRKKIGNKVGRIRFEMLRNGDLVENDVYRPTPTSMLSEDMTFVGDAAQDPDDSGCAMGLYELIQRYVRKVVVEELAKQPDNSVDHSGWYPVSHSRGCVR